MSLAINAAPFDNIDHPPMHLSDTGTAPKRKNNRTIKLRNQKQEKISAENVNSMMSNIHNRTEGGESPDFNEDMGHFNPMAPPMSMGVEQTKNRDASDPSDSASSPAEYNPQSTGPILPDQPVTSNSVDYDKYRRYMPNYKQMYGDGVDVDQLAGDQPIHSSTLYGPVPSSMNVSNNPNLVSDPLIAKLNHVIHLLEEQKDDKTSRVSEEVMLYFFLGIFVIFIVDSFTKLGKYTR